MTQYDLVRTWKQEQFTLHIYDTYKMKGNKPRLAYEFYDETFGEHPVFQGEDFGCSPLHAIDSDQAVAALLGFLSLQPGDTDAEYFEDYSSEQLEWAETSAEELQHFALELEES